MAVSVENPYGERDCEDPIGRGFTKVDESSSVLFGESCFPDIPVEDG